MTKKPTKRNPLRNCALDLLAEASRLNHCVERAQSLLMDITEKIRKAAGGAE